MLKNIIVATHNNHKVVETKFILQNTNIQIFSLKDFNLTSVAEETGSTYKENAEIKATFYGNLLKKNVIADDSGFEVVALDGFPGTQSARWKSDVSYPEKCLEIIKMFRETKSNNLFANFYAEICFFNYEKQTKSFFSGAWHGSLSLQPKGNNGFGYDPIFVDKIYRLTAAELPDEVKNSISHRAEALIKFKKMAIKYET